MFLPIRREGLAPIVCKEWRPISKFTTHVIAQPLSLMQGELEGIEIAKLFFQKKKPTKNKSESGASH